MKPGSIAERKMAAAPEALSSLFKDEKGILKLKSPINWYILHYGSAILLLYID
jgi:hypothetical protein